MISEEAIAHHAALAGAVKVKPLVWLLEQEDVLVSNAPWLHQYRIVFDGRAAWMCLRNGRWVRCETEDGAKSVAQADYEARILSTLEPTHNAERAELARQNAALRAQVAALTADNEALQRMVANKGHDDRCLIWSHEHGCWWRPDSAGYTNDAKAAGVYSRAEAMLISHRGRDGWRDGCKPDELPVRLSDLPNWARDALANPAAKPGGAA